MPKASGWVSAVAYSATLKEADSTFATGGMSAKKVLPMPDLFQIIDDIDAGKQAMVIKRLEDRAQMPKVASIREGYVDKIGLPLTGRIHELGCGTGAVCRAIASRPGFSERSLDPICQRV